MDKYFLDKAPKNEWKLSAGNLLYSITSQKNTQASKHVVLNQQGSH